MAGPYVFPEARPHGAISEPFPDVFFVTGTIRMPGPITVTCSRNMVVVRQGGELVLINTVRLDEQGLQALDALGKVAHVLRIAGFHGSDDPFYKDRYGAKVWSVKGSAYTRGFALRPPDDAAYFQPDAWMDETTTLPLAGRLYRFASVPNGEGLIVLDREGGIAVSGDALQNWATADAYFNWLGRTSMRLMGFLRAHNVGPGWLKQTKPDPAELRGMLELPFEHVLPAHGSPVIGNARERYRPAIEAAARWADKAH
ncbi:MAG: hypothetical protein KC621_12115 [Myxococcales bacterium]|nr:hypothetical protein [Myxococcales bacterium]